MAPLVKKITFLGLVAVLAVTGLAPVVAQAASRPVPAGAKAVGPEVDPSTVFVKLAGGAGAAKAGEVLARHGLTAEARAGGTGFLAVATRGRSPEALRRRLEVDADVEAVSLSYVRRAAYAPSDLLLSQQLEQAVARFPQAWDVVRDASSVVVAVLDSGVDLDHPDLAAQLVAGADVVGAGDGDPSDELGHGTAVAGIIGATADNGIGIAGGAFDTLIMPVRVLDAEGAGSDEDVIEGIDWAVANGADVINMSLGGPGDNRALGAAVQRARDAGVVVVAATGNGDGPYLNYPAAHDGVVGVAAADSSGRLAYFSNYGSSADITAVGVSVRSTSLVAGPFEAYGDGAQGTGTSFAAPQVAAAAALLRAQNPGWTVAQVESRLLATARDAGPSGFDEYYGAGLLDAYAAVGGPAQAPLPPEAGDAFEPNDTAGTAAVIGATASATIAPEGDVDWFATDVAGTGTLTVQVSPPPPPYAFPDQGMDPMLWIFDSGGTLRGSVDDYGLDDDEVLSVPAAGPGRYYVAVANWLGSTRGGTYTVTVTAPAPAPTTTAPVPTTAPPAPTTTAPPAPTTTAPPPPPPTAPAAPAPARSGYWMVGAGGDVYAFGDSPWLGNASVGASEAVDLEPTPTGAGYWVVDGAGRVSAFGDAPYLGGVEGMVAGERATSVSRTPSGRGYWVFTSLGRVFSRGDAPFLGDMSGTRLNGPVLDSIPTPSGAGYYMVASDGGIFTFGDARFLGSMGGSPLNAPVQSLVPDPDGEGYWLVASDGGIFTFAAAFHGSMGSTRLNRPVTGMVGFNGGYLMVAEDGGIFTFGQAAFHGSLGASPPARPVTSVAPLG
ncbi:MAG TPA: S8 family serine peptidase [Acidimicrobiales bacterium]|nr:S8 family serine peptidase [Acidimicrobiales bacterium]